MRKWGRRVWDWTRTASVLWSLYDFITRGVSVLVALSPLVAGYGVTAMGLIVSVQPWVAWAAGVVVSLVVFLVLVWRRYLVNPIQESIRRELRSEDTLTHIDREMPCRAARRTVDRWESEEGSR